MVRQTVLAAYSESTAVEAAKPSRSGRRALYTYSDNPMRVAEYGRGMDSRRWRLVLVLPFRQKTATVVCSHAQGVIDLLTTEDIL